MPVEFVAAPSAGSLPVYVVPREGLAAAGLSPGEKAWARANDFNGQSDRVLLLPGSGGEVAGALLGIGAASDPFAPLVFGTLGRHLPEGRWHLAAAVARPDEAAIGIALGSYVFTRYGKRPGRTLRFALPEGADPKRVRRVIDGVFLARDLINTPTNDLGPEALEAAARKLAAEHGASVSVVAGDGLLEENLPMIHAVGRAAAEAPRLIDLRWGPEGGPKVTLVGKGVCFDTGGLDIKPASSMLLMKKDMGGAANVLGLAAMVMTAKQQVRLRVMIPAVENAIAGNSFRPGDVLTSRKGLTVEIGNTDAEGRLILADAMALADEEAPQLLLDMATLTGAARVALGPDLAPFYSADEDLARDLSSAGTEVADPLWRMPLWDPYDAKLSSKVADLNNVTSDSFAGSITAALFLRRFIERSSAWAHFDIFAWNPSERPHGPVGGEVQAIRALERLLSNRYPAKA
jgi:leucyl aminopeptidase